MSTQASTEPRAERRRRTSALYVDLHSHVVPSGDDGARSVEEGLELCRHAAAHGTRLLYATPHAQPAGRWHAWTVERQRRAVESLERMQDACAAFGLELRLGWEVAPRGIVGEVRSFALDGLDAVLVEFPGPWFEFADSLLETRRQIDQIRAAGLEVVLAHPERCVEIQQDPRLVLPFAEDGALICFNADSFLGGHGDATERCAWQLLGLGLGDLVASDAHRRDRPSRLHEAVEAIARRTDRERAVALADGSALTRLSAL
ncbi:MAG TPA: CpsB/CapC family capsule biosynthesis tyrosine phosphatase [Gaiellaceae bacterium]|nr:CpsB/CapC family capsule biosynthesis tyrosine phosphatase [Gaiellaceae bacterium]